MSAAPLAGALDTLALADVLQLLDLGRKSGVLAVEANDGVRRGLVRLSHGFVAAARFRDADARELRDPADAVAAMLALGSGRFTFAADPPNAASDGPGSRAAGMRVEALLLEATRRLDEGAHARLAGADPANPPERRAWDARSAVPAPAGRVPVLAGAGDGADDVSGDLSPVALRAADWALLAAVDGRRTVAEVAAAAGVDVDAAACACDALARLGLLRFAGHGPADRAAADGAVAPAPTRSSTR